MTVDTAQRINELSTERSNLFRQAANGRRGDPAVRQRIALVSDELERLWDLRRQERAGRLEGIDRLIDSAYQRVYGADYEDAVSPPLLDDGEAVSDALAA